mmetsp:Transcript_76576/g.212705  ORF Transcript_76576/g.212705 Transcript_76576/m.212705 type:complete len:935 (+) Transcript_76576:86-2890(+)
MDFAAVECNQIYDNHEQFDAAIEPRGNAQSAQLRDPRMSYRPECGPAASPAERRPGHVEESRLGYSRQSQQKYRKGMLGLTNLGNTCFMNAALQCLTHTHGLQKYFRLCSHAYTSKGQSARQKLLMAFANWFERDWAKPVTAHYHTPEDILLAVRQLNPTFSGYAQQDSQEFLRCVLDNMHEELRREIPDDLDVFFMKRFGIEVGSPGSRNLAAGSQRPNNHGSNHDDSSTSGKTPSTPSASTASSVPSATRQLMQLCQTTEHVTDVGEIRLPAANAEPPSRAVGGGGEFSTTDGEKGEEDAAAKTHFSSIVSELFQGRMVSVVRCLDCHKTSRTEEVVYDVSIPIPNANEVPNGSASVMGDAFPPMSASSQQQMQMSSGIKGSTSPTWTGVLSGLPGKVKSWFYDKGVEVTDCLRKHCAPEYLTGKDKYFCEHCKRKNDCEKKIAFKELPEILCIHLKRFRYEASWFNGTKNSKVVTFPVSKTLDMSSFCDSPPPHPAEYKLIGLIQHIGSMAGGHYISYCQHKRKPQDWYEFDDVQVNVVSQEQVERAEPYVLFYQRMPTKAKTLDRQNFKNEQRRVLSQIRTFLMNQAQSSAGARGDASEEIRGGGDKAGGGAGGELASGSGGSHSIADELRLNSPALRNLYRNPPAELDIVFVSKHWYVRLTSMSRPGPLDNFEYICPHGLLGSHSIELAAEPFVPVSRALYQSLVHKYGGGPILTSLEVCSKCQAHIRAYNERKQAEYDLVSKYDTKDTGDGKYWYIVDALWVNKWKRYVKSEPVTDIRDMCHPGEVTNERLFDSKEPHKFRQNLRLKNDYIGVNARVWWLFMHVHGGGPLICCEELDIYSAASPPETQLGLVEFRDTGEGAREFARRISRQFVDNCHGDMELYEQRYGSGAASASSDVEMSEAATTTGTGIQSMSVDGDQHERPGIKN